MRDLASNIKTVAALAPATLSVDTNGITIDRLGYESLAFAIAMGVGGDTFTGSKRLDFIMEHSNDGATFEAVGADNVIGPDPVTAGIVLSQRTAHAAADVRTIGYVDGTIGDRRYVRLNLDVVGTHAGGTPLSVTAILAHGPERPVT